MDKHRKSLVFSLLLTLVFMLASFGATLADAHGKGQGPCGMGAMPGPRQGFEPAEEDGPDMPRNFGQYLGLSTKQMQQMQALRFASEKKTIDARGEFGQKRLERKALLDSDTINWQKVDQLTDEIAKAQATLEKEKMRQREEIKKILTPEQLEKFNAADCRLGPGGQGPGSGPGCGLGRGLGRGPGCGMGKGMGF